MKKTFESVCKFARWGIAGMLSLIAAFPAHTSINAAI